MSRFDGVHFQPDNLERWSAAWCALGGAELRSDGQSRGEALIAPQYIVSRRDNPAPVLNDALLRLVSEPPYYLATARYREDGATLAPRRAPPAYVSAAKLNAARARATSPHGDATFLVYAQHTAELDAGFFFVGKSSSLTYTVGDVRSSVGPVQEGRLDGADAAVGDDDETALGAADETLGASWLAGVRVEQRGASSATFYYVLCPAMPPGHRLLCVPASTLPLPPRPAQAIEVALWKRLQGAIANIASAAYRTSTVLPAALVGAARGTLASAPLALYRQLEKPAPICVGGASKTAGSRTVMEHKLELLVLQLVIVNKSRKRVRPIRRDVCMHECMPFVLLLCRRLSCSLASASTPLPSLPSPFRPTLCAHALQRERAAHESAIVSTCQSNLFPEPAFNSGAEAARVSQFIRLHRYSLVTQWRDGSGSMMPPMSATDYMLCIASASTAAAASIGRPSMSLYFAGLLHALSHLQPVLLADAPGDGYASVTALAALSATMRGGAAPVG